MASSSEARRKLEERLRLGPSTFNDVISTGGDSLRDPEDVARSFWEGLTATAEQTLKTLPTANLGNEVLRQQIEEEVQKKLIQSTPTWAGPLTRL
jgi:hypothetical protein